MLVDVVFWHLVFFAIARINASRRLFILEFNSFAFFISPDSLSNKEVSNTSRILHNLRLIFNSNNIVVDGLIED